MVQCMFRTKIIICVVTCSTVVPMYMSIIFLVHITHSTHHSNFEQGHTCFVKSTKERKARSHWNSYLKRPDKTTTFTPFSSTTANRTHETRAATSRSAHHHRLGSLHRTHRIPLAGALARGAGAHTAAAMAPVMAIEQGRSERVSEGKGRGRVRIVEAVGEAGDIGEHGGGTAASAAHRAGRAVDVRVERGEGVA
jgi:hypothetical protein